jgi:hypothetical protein
MTIVGVADSLAGFRDILCGHPDRTVIHFLVW